MPPGETFPLDSVGQWLAQRGLFRAGGAVRRATFFRFTSVISTRFSHDVFVKYGLRE